MLSGVSYVRASKDGLLIEMDEKEQMLDVDTIVICTGQNPVRALYDQVKANREAKVHLIGGAHEAKELDAKHAIHTGIARNADRKVSVAIGHSERGKAACEPGRHSGLCNLFAFGS